MFIVDVKMINNTFDSFAIGFFGVELWRPLSTLGMWMTSEGKEEE